MSTSFGRLLASTVIMAAVTAAGAAFAQQPPASKQQPKAAPKQQPKAAPKDQPKGAPQQQAQQGQQPQIYFSPWTKICQKPDANAKQVCVTGRDGRVENGMPVAAAMLIEPEGEARKILRITLPLGMALAPGTRVVIDQGQPMNAPYVICFQNGCVSDYEASQELINNMKKGTGLALQGMNGGGQAITLVIPLADFAKTYDGPPMDQKQFEEMQKRMQEEQQKRLQALQQQQQQQRPGN